MIPFAGEGVAAASATAEAADGVVDFENTPH